MKVAINPELQIKKLKRRAIWLAVYSGILSGLLLFLIFVQIVLIPQKHEVKINYGDLNEEQKEHVNSIMADVKEKYLLVQKSITFTTQEIKREPGRDSLSDKVTVGTNDQTGNIRVMYRDNDMALRATLCHEMLHTFFRIDEYSHAIIYDVEKYLPCYKSTQKTERIEWES